MNFSPFAFGFAFVSGAVAVFPKVTTTAKAFSYSNVGIVDFHCLESITASECFDRCASITALILRNTNAVCTLVGTLSYSGGVAANGAGYIYVPAALVDSYKAATNWSAYASNIRAIEDYPDICGGV